MFKIFKNIIARKGIKLFHYISHKLHNYFHII